MCYAVVLVSAMLVLLCASILASKFVVWCVGEDVCVFVVALMIARAIFGGWVVPTPVPPFPRVADPRLCWGWILCVGFGCVDIVIVVVVPSRCRLLLLRSWSSCMVRRLCCVLIGLCLCVLCVALCCLVERRLLLLLCCGWVLVGLLNGGIGC